MFCQFFSAEVFYFHFLQGLGLSSMFCVCLTCCNSPLCPRLSWDLDTEASLHPDLPALPPERQGPVPTDATPGAGGLWGLGAGPATSAEAREDTSISSFPDEVRTFQDQPPDTVLKPCPRDPGLGLSYPPPCPTKEPTHPLTLCKAELLRSARPCSWQGEQSLEQRNQHLRVAIRAQRGKQGDGVFAGRKCHGNLEQEGVGAAALRTNGQGWPLGC